MLLKMAPRITKPIGATVDVGIYSAARTTDGGLVDGALSPNHGDEFSALLTGAAEGESVRSLRGTDATWILGMFAMVAAVIS